jgi:hypothetical protein
MPFRLFTQPEHDQVVRASAETYNQLVQQGYKVAINPGSEKNQQVGSGNYPDVIVWRPNPPPNQASGIAIIIEEIETEDSVTQAEAAQWKQYGQLGVSKFILLVPVSKVRDALNLVQANGVRVSEIWSYEVRGGRYFFTKHFTLA